MLYTLSLRLLTQATFSHRAAANLFSEDFLKMFNKRFGQWKRAPIELQYWTSKPGGDEILHPSHQIVLTDLAISLLILLRYCSLNLNLPTVPCPTTATNATAQLPVMIRPTGKIPRVVPGITNLILLPMTADVNAGVPAEAVGAGRSANTPLTKLASPMLMVVLTAPLAAVMADKVI